MKEFRKVSKPNKFTTSRGVSKDFQNILNPNRITTSRGVSKGEIYKLNDFTTSRG